MKKILIWAAVAFLIFFVAFRPSLAGDVVAGLAGVIADIARGFASFISDLAS